MYMTCLHGAAVRPYILVGAPNWSSALQAIPLKPFDNWYKPKPASTSAGGSAVNPSWKFTRINSFILKLSSSNQSVECKRPTLLAYIQGYLL